MLVAFPVIIRSPLPSSLPLPQPTPTLILFTVSSATPLIYRVADAPGVLARLIAKPTSHPELKTANVPETPDNRSFGVLRLTPDVEAGT